MTAKKAWGTLAQFASPANAMDAAEILRNAGYRRFDVHSPFPIHHMEKSMGLRDTRLPWIILGMGAFGLAAAVGLQGWAMGTAYPFIVSGKPYFSLPAFVPIIFELTVLFSAFGAVFGMLAINRLPALHHPLFRNAAFSRATRDGFFVSVESGDPKYDMLALHHMMRHAGAVSIEEVYE